MVSTKLKDTVIIAATGLGFLWFVVILAYSHDFLDPWFPTPAVALVFELLFSAWCLAEIANNLRSRVNTVSANQDRGSYYVVNLALFVSLFLILFCRTLPIGLLTGAMQYAGLVVIAAGILLREWAVLVLGNHFTVRVQADGKSQMVTGGPYRYIRHPSYTGTLLTLAGFALAVGSWLGAILVIIIALPAYAYRMRVEEEALQNAFGKEFEEYKARTGRLIPGL